MSCKFDSNIWWFGGLLVFCNLMGIISLIKVKVCLFGLYGLNRNLRSVYIGVMKILEE